MSKLQNRLAIIIRRKDVYSQTFVRAHIDHLCDSVEVYFGAPFPTSSLNEKLFLNSTNTLLRYLMRITYCIRKILGMTSLNSKEYKLKKAVQRQGAEVVFAEFGIVGSQVYPVCKEAGLPLIVMFHGYDLSKEHVLKAHANYRSLREGACEVIVVSQHMKRRLLSFGFSEARITVSPYGVSKKFFDLLPQGTERQILYVGRFVKKKNPLAAIHVFHALHTEFSDARLVMAGDGELLASAKQLVRDLNIERQVLFRGAISHDEVALLLQSSRALLLPSCTPEDGDEEGAPVIILEAMAASLPVVSTKHAGIPELILDKETGFLVDENDVDSMIRCMGILLKDGDLARRMGQCAREYAREHFTLERHIEDLVGVIKRVIS